MTTLKLYLVENNTGEGTGYDTYSEFVVCAESEKEARETHPCDNQNWEYDKIYSSWISFKNVNKLNVKYLGEADKGVEKGVIVASYHAG